MSIVLSSLSQELLVDAPLLLNWSLVKATDLLVHPPFSGITTTDFVYEISDTTVVYEIGDTTECPDNPIAQSRRYYQSRCSDPKLDEPTRRTAIDAVVQIDRITDMYINGHLRIVELDDTETDLFCQLTSTKQAENLQLTWPLDHAAASCVAVAIARGMVLTSDDDNAWAALDRLSPGHPTQSTQELLRTAVRERLIDKEKANAIHEAMCKKILWSRQPPYPNV